jgi:hypothetical protein
MACIDTERYNRENLLLYLIHIKGNIKGNKKDPQAKKLLLLLILSDKKDSLLDLLLSIHRRSLSCP